MYFFQIFEFFKFSYSIELKTKDTNFSKNSDEIKMLLRLEKEKSEGWRKIKRNIYSLECKKNKIKLIKHVDINDIVIYILLIRKCVFVEKAG